MNEQRSPKFSADAIERVRDKQCASSWCGCHAEEMLGALTADDLAAALYEMKRLNAANIEIRVNHFLPEGTACVIQERELTPEEHAIIDALPEEDEVARAAAMLSTRGAYIMTGTTRWK